MNKGKRHKKPQGKEVESIYTMAQDAYKKVQDRLTKEEYNQLQFQIPVHSLGKALKLEDGPIYEGSWNSEGKKDGFGIQKWQDGTLYMGQYVDGKANGKGFLDHSDGDLYWGNWVDDKA